MNIKRFILAGLAVFVTFQILDYVIHSLILSPVYEEFSSVWRPDMESMMWVLMAASFVFSFLFVYIYSKGFGHGLMAGIGYGFVIGLAAMCFPAINQYVIYPLPGFLVVQWCIYGLIQYVLCGVVASLIYKPKK